MKKPSWSKIRWHLRIHTKTAIIYTCSQYTDKVAMSNLGLLNIAADAVDSLLLSVYLSSFSLYGVFMTMIASRLHNNQLLGRFLF